MSFFLINAHAESSVTNLNSHSELHLDRPTSIWDQSVGGGFRSTTQALAIYGGGTIGLDMFGSHYAHDMALVNFSYGHVLGPVLGEGHWYRGNWEFRAELFTGAQFNPDSAWLVGFTPYIRYNLATGTRWIPFIEVGAGLTGTSIGMPDLNGTFQFNDQGGVGFQWFIRDDAALTFVTRYTHMSNAGIHEPNPGLNGVTCLIGFTFFF